MKPKLALLLALLANSIFAQKTCNEMYFQKFTRQQLEQDVDFIKEKIINAHVNPFTEISESEFEEIFKHPQGFKRWNDSKDFYFLAKPLIVTLNDEHSSMSDYCVTDSIKKYESTSVKI
jgi:hypothetical protein